MLNKLTVEYPVLVYQKKGFFVADCVFFNLATFGATEEQAIQSIQNIMNENIDEYNIIIKPVYESNVAVT